MYSKYPKVLHLKDTKYFHLTGQEVYLIEEKIDGSQFRFGINKGERWFGSKTVLYTEERPADKMFRKAVEEANAALDRLIGLNKAVNSIDIEFYAEYLQKPKHNTLTYDRVPKHGLILFDVRYNGDWQEYDDVADYAEILDIDIVPKLGMAVGLPPTEELNKYLANPSVLGGEIIEGVVIKDYHTVVELNGEVRPLMVKYVRDDFKELNDANWKMQSPNNAVDVVFNTLNKETIFRKAVQHLKEQGQYTGEMRDMAVLVHLVEGDILDEHTERIKDILFDFYIKKILQQATKGLADYYKKVLYEELRGFEGKDDE